MNIAIIGTGYVGLVSGACFADMGMQVHCIDKNEKKIQDLQNDIIPIYEPGLEDLVHKNRNEGRLHFDTAIDRHMERLEVLFIAVGTPPGTDGAADLSAVYEVAREVGRKMDHYMLIVTKSTVPVGTTYKVRDIIKEEQKARGVEIPFDVASNPEFLKEGAAIKDFMSPDRVVVGVDSDKARETMTRLYRPFLINNFRVIFMDIASSELTKYASNAMLATRISFMNEIANLCEVIGADVESVRKGMGADKRIGSSFLYAGCGYGGSCFPKDVKALVQTASEYGLSMQIISHADQVNDRQKERPHQKVLKHLGDDLKGKVVAIWGLSFKPETDDMRDATSIVTVNALIQAGATVKVFDPVAMNAAKTVLPDSVVYTNNIYEAATDADAVVLLTEWKQFRMPDWSHLASLMRGHLIIDGRNIYPIDDVKGHGLTYDGIGRP